MQKTIRITEEEFDKLSDYRARIWKYCPKCHNYYLKDEAECPCGLSKQLQIIDEDLCCVICGEYCGEGRMVCMECDKKGE
jgi:hypothetical protein